jgi:hypothetical protein
LGEGKQLAHAKKGQNFYMLGAPVPFSKGPKKFRKTIPANELKESFLKA